MGTIKVAINGFGTIGKRVADAVDAQKTWKLLELPRLVQASVVNWQ